MPRRPSSSPALPRIYLQQHCKTAKIQLPRLKRIATQALPLVLELRKQPPSVLQDLSEVEVSLISDADITEVHAQFLDDPTPTDVITFHHGEILISLDTAARQATEHHHPFEDEVALYAIHGLLHLAGWDDHQPEEAARMAEHQTQVLKQCLQSLT